jgi:hypothetical protein
MNSSQDDESCDGRGSFSRIGQAGQAMPGIMSGVLLLLIQNKVWKRLPDGQEELIEVA